MPWERRRALNTFYGLIQDNPPLQFPGEILLISDTEGSLISFRRVPEFVEDILGNLNSYVALNECMLQSTTSG
jgi:hypothetical protein